MVLAKLPEAAVFREQRAVSGIDLADVSLPRLCIIDCNDCVAHGATRY
jgi:hypothetical protein